MAQADGEKNNGGAVTLWDSPTFPCLADKGSCAKWEPRGTSVCVCAQRVHWSRASINLQSQIQSPVKTKLATRLFHRIKDINTNLCLWALEWIANMYNCWCDEWLQIWACCVTSCAVQSSLTLHNRPKYFHTHAHIQACYHPHYSHCSNGVTES